MRAVIILCVTGLLAGCVSSEPKAPVRPTSGEHAVQIIAECMRQLGWPATASGDSWSAGSMRVEQQPAFDADASFCSKDILPDIGAFTDDDWQAAYEQVTIAVECLAGIDIVVPNVPSIQSYRDGGGAWSVYQELISSGIILPAGMRPYLQKCPQPEYWPSG